MSVRRKLTVERAMMMLPLNVVMVAKVQGKIDKQKLRDAVDAVSMTHLLIRTRIEIDEQQVAWLCSNKVPSVPVQFIDGPDVMNWRVEAVNQLRTAFDMENGPLVRLVFIPAQNGGYLIVCAHHVVCDGISLAWLVADILKNMASPTGCVTAKSVPAPISVDSVRNPPPTSRIQKAVFSLVNKSWEKKNIRFNAAQRQEMHQRYWQNNSTVNLETAELDKDQTQQLVDACRHYGVTVNSALWTAFLKAQNEFLPTQKVHGNAGMARSIRHLMREPVGQSLGVYASSLGLKLDYKSTYTFWENAKAIHFRITRRMEKVHPLQMLVSEQLRPTILDSLYFAKFGLCDAALAKKMLKKMNWHHLHYGYSITNVGRLDVPTEFGDLHLDRLYGPIVYSDVNEKTVGAATVGGKLSIAMTTGYQLDSATAMQLMQIATNSLTQL